MRPTLQTERRAPSNTEDETTNASRERVIGACNDALDGDRFRGACRSGSGWKGDRCVACYGRESARFEVRWAKGLGARMRERIRTRQGRIRVERHSVRGLFADEQSPGGVRSGQLPCYDWECNEAEVFPATRSPGISWRSPANRKSPGCA